MPEPSSAERTPSRLRAMREAAGLTLDVVAQRSGISKAQLSRIETGRRQPSVASLLAIADVLGTSVGALLEQPLSGTPVTAASSELQQGGLRVRPLSGQTNAGLECFEVDIPPGASSEEFVEHPGEELIYVLEGTLLLELDRETHVVAAGNTAQFPGRLLHRLSAPARQHVRVLVVTSR